MEKYYWVVEEILSQPTRWVYRIYNNKEELILWSSKYYTQENAIIDAKEAMVHLLKEGE